VACGLAKTDHEPNFGILYCQVRILALNESVGNWHHEYISCSEIPNMLVRRYWQPFPEFNTVKQQLDQLFDEFAGTETTPTTWTPAVSLVDTEDALVLHVQLPGINAESIDVQASREVVAISGDRTAPELPAGACLRRNEFRYGTFRRVVSLPVAIEPKSVTANYENGILVLTLPKAEDVRNQVIKVAVGGVDQPAIAQADHAPASEVDTTATAETAETDSTDAW
jgi:HSP20 family protein